MAKGFELAGFNQVAGLDWFDAAEMTYRHNFNHPFINGDIKDKEVKKLFVDTINSLSDNKLTVLSGGFPARALVCLEIELLMTKETHYIRIC